jgi:hypothetical protein
MTPRDPDPRTRYGTPPLAAHAGASTRAAIAAYVAYRNDPVMEPKPTDAQVRLVAQYCQEWIRSPLFTYPADGLAQLRWDVERIRTVADLADWLWDCRRIMRLEPL